MCSDTCRGIPYPETGSLKINPEHRGQRKGIRIIFFLLVSLVLVVAISTAMGYISIPVADVVKIIWFKITENSEALKHLNRVFPYVIIDVRLPRILTAAVVGAGLGMSGAIFQGILLNPLADPYTLGISSGAAFGASLALVLNISFLSIDIVPLFAFAGAVLTLVAVMYISSVRGQLSSNNLILAGVIVAAILSAGIGFLKYIADEEVSIIIFWLMGSFASKTWYDVLLTILFVTFGFIVFEFYSRDLNIISLGDQISDSLGVNTKRVKKILLVVASLVTAICVSVSGIIGFVGLIIPHLMRFILGPDNQKLIPASALGGALLLLIADTTTRSLLPHEIPIGILTSLLGGPFFCYIFRKKELGKVHGT